MLYDSVHDKLLPLPDETLVYPAHGAGSLCGKHLSTDTVSTMGIQREYNYALQPMTREEFVAVVTADQPDSPAYFTYDAVLNAKERPTLDEALARGPDPALPRRSARPGRSRRPAPRCPLERGVRGRAPAGEREHRARRQLRHVVRARSSITSCRSSSSASPAASVEAAMRLGRIGFDNVAGYLDGGMLAAAEPARARRADRADHSRDARRAAHGAGSRRSSSTSAPRTRWGSGSREA